MTATTYLCFSTASARASQGHGAAARLQAVGAPVEAAFSSMGVPSLQHAGVSQSSRERCRQALAPGCTGDLSMVWQVSQYLLTHSRVEV